VLKDPNSAEAEINELEGGEFGVGVGLPFWMVDPSNANVLMGGYLVMLGLVFAVGYWFWARPGPDDRARGALIKAMRLNDSLATFYEMYGEPVPVGDSGGDFEYTPVDEETAEVVIWYIRQCNFSLFGTFTAMEKITNFGVACSQTVQGMLEAHSRKQQNLIDLRLAALALPKTTPNEKIPAAVKKDLRSLIESFIAIEKRLGQVIDFAKSLDAHGPRSVILTPTAPKTDKKARQEKKKAVAAVKARNVAEKEQESQRAA